MTEHDLVLLEQLRAGTAAGAVEADDPTAVAGALVADGARQVPAPSAASWAEEAEVLRRLADAVLAAEEVVAGARAHERSQRAAPAEVGLPAPSGVGVDRHADRHAEGPDADRAAVRFAVAILVPALAGGAAVYVADGTLLAVAAPAVSLAGVVAVALAHHPRRYAGAASSEGASGHDRRTVTDPPPARAGAVAEVPASPAVRAAEAHLRRQEAAWKVAWWERGLAPVDVGRWIGPPADGAPRATLVVVDDADQVPDRLVATMAAAVPAAVRVVVVRGRTG